MYLWLLFRMAAERSMACFRALESVLPSQAVLTAVSTSPRRRKSTGAKIWIPMSAGLRRYMPVYFEQTATDYLETVLCSDQTASAALSSKCGQCCACK